MTILPEALIARWRQTMRLEGEIPVEAQVDGATRTLFAASAGLVVCFLVWAVFGQLDVVAEANGEVVPSSQVKHVQHLEGGIVQAILVKEGDRVEHDQPLVELKTTSSGADVAELQIHVTDLRLTIARLEAEAEGRSPAFPADLKAEAPTLVEHAANLYQARTATHRNQLDGAHQTVKQRQQERHQIEARSRDAQGSLRLIQEQVRISEDLLNQGLTNRYTHLNLLRSESDLKSKLNEDTNSLGRLQAAEKEAELQLDHVDQAYQQEVRGLLDTARRDLAEYDQRLRKYQDSLERTVLRSPVEGVVKAVYVATQGGVVKAGDTVVDIVPSGDTLVIEARLPVQDVGYVRSGQIATVRLASADAMRLGNIEGSVALVSPDTTVTKDGSFYKVRIETGRGYFQRGDVVYRLLPGMQVTASIRTGHRSVLEYLFDPFYDNLGHAMRER